MRMFFVQMGDLHLKKATKTPISQANYSKSTLFCCNLLAAVLIAIMKSN
jgi:hypothetical protein